MWIWQPSPFPTGRNLPGRCFLRRRTAARVLHATPITECSKPGIFDSAAKVELLDGEIIMMSPIGPEHVALISILNEFFAKHLPETLQCRIQAPILLSNHSEPEPDLAVVQRRPDSYRTEHPDSTNIVLIVEVAQSSRGRDLGWKRHIYAASGIMDYWVVDIDEQVVVVHRQPTGTDYLKVESLGLSSTIAPLAATNCQLHIGQLFG